MKNTKKRKNRKFTRKDVQQAVRTERDHCCQIVCNVVHRFDDMGFRHDAAKAAGARAALTALGASFDSDNPDFVRQVAGLTYVEAF